MMNWKTPMTLSSTPSTQGYLKTERPLILNTIVRADVQNAGVGTHQKKWVSDLGDLLFSFAFASQAFNAGTIMVAVSLALLDALDEPLAIKPPNDIYKDGQKCGGILIEQLLIEGEMICFVGIGVNFVEKTAVTASHLKRASFEPILARFQSAFSNHLQTEIQTLIARYNQHVLWDQLRISYQGQVITTKPLEPDFYCETSLGRLPWAHLNFEII
jgi:biotin-(acetyl-CoA carboxylase) ligase